MFSNGFEWFPWQIFWFVHLNTGGSVHRTMNNNFGENWVQFWWKLGIFPENVPICQGNFGEAQKILFILACFCHSRTLACLASCFVFISLHFCILPFPHYWPLMGALTKICQTFFTSGEKERGKKKFQQNYNLRAPTFQPDITEWC